MKYRLARPRLLGLICAAIAVGLGLFYMWTAGAPPLYRLVNLAALVLGAAAWLALRPFAGQKRTGDGWVVLTLAMALLATALFGVPVDNATRWVSVGPLSLQVSLIVLPAMIVLYARSADAIGTIGVAIAALALAAQPDRAMAAMLAAGVGTVMFARRGKLSVSAFAAAILAFAATLIRPDALPAVPFVDGILYTAFGVHPAAGLAVVAGALILLAPGLVGALRMASQRRVLLAFGSSWAAVVAAATLGNYPTPLVGYGGSAVLGYLLSVALLPRELSDGAAADRGDFETGERPTAAGPEIAR